MSQASWGADSPQGPGWWQASDGKWYPPQDTPPPAPPPVAPQPVTPGWQPGQTWVTYDGPVEQVPRLKPLYAWLLAIPEFFLLIGYAIMASFSQYAAVFGVLFKGRVHPRSHDNIVRLYRYQWRYMTYVACWRNEKFSSPPPSAIDPGDDPAKLSVAYGGEGLARLGPLYKWILAIPQFIVLFFRGIVAYVHWVIGFFGVLFKGRFGQNQRDYIVKFMHDSTQLNAYLLLTDRKPQF